MRRVTISVACALVIWMIALMGTEVSATQPQVSIRMLNDEVIDLHDRMKFGALTIVE